jgi:hypothetical protein
VQHCNHIARTRTDGFSMSIAAPHAFNDMNPPPPAPTLSPTVGVGGGRALVRAAATNATAAATNATAAATNAAARH